ncbi:type III pantothenate kinase [Gilvimarinus polysaccharolyticus]|uniref:type III pantothenate kinase n=1 Tax=Gilvimarinus polysaccharolyticus TaxID=863921 RepID=UPI00067361A2|nr:type III pantothenate kinase [Gilvimarinus polysaccharolyticus]
MILQIDIGNSRIKWRLRSKGLTLRAGVAEHGNYYWLQGLIGVQQVWVSSVVMAESERLSAALMVHGCPKAEFAQAQACAGGVTSGYQEPATLGVDRWLGLLGARQLCAGPVLLVDAGTALTVDLLASDGRHLGGYIAPGLALMRQSLALKSPALNLEPLSCYSVSPGDTSASAIDAGLVAMGRGLIETGRSLLVGATQEPQVSLLFTGGDGDVWRQVMSEGFGEPELLFLGLEYFFSGERY